MTAPRGTSPHRNARSSESFLSVPARRLLPAYWGGPDSFSLTILSSWPRWSQDPSLIPNAIEELLRYESPSPVQGRWLTQEVELHGQLIPADSKVLLLTGSAGRDERVYPEPDEFDIRRNFRLHVAFGYGIHFCLGAALARMEGKIALEETVKRYKTWTVDKERSVPLHTSTVRGYQQLPIRV